MSASITLMSLNSIDILLCATESPCDAHYCHCILLHCGLIIDSVNKLSLRSNIFFLTIYMYQFHCTPEGFSLLNFFCICLHPIAFSSCFFFISHLWFSMDIHVFHWRENSFPEFEWFLLLNLHPSEVSTICHIVEFGVKFFRIFCALKEHEYKVQSLNVGVNHVSFNSNCRNLDLLHIQIGVALFKVS